MRRDTARKPNPIRRPPIRRIRPDSTKRITTVIDTLRRDTLRKDSVVAQIPVNPDSLLLPLPPVVQMRFDTVVYTNPHFFSFTNPIRLREAVHVEQSKDSLFYCSMGILFLFGLLRTSFSRYFQDLFKLFFRTSLKQRQAKELLLQSPFPSLMLNVLFFLSSGLFLTLLFEQFNMGERFSFLILYGLCALGLTAVYFLKFVGLKICGWLFRVVDATDGYIFIIFTANKVLGIMLLPFVVLLAFAVGAFAQVAFTFSLIFIGGVFLYRYYLAFTTVRRQVHMHVFHFFLYFLAFEVVPLLLVNKLIFRLMG